MNAEEWMAGEVTYQPTEADYVGAHRDWFINVIWSRRGLATIRTAALATAATLAVIGYLIGDSRPAVAVAFASGLLLGAFLILLCWGLSYALMPRRAGRLFRQHRALQKNVSYGWSDTGLTYRGANGSGQIAWEDMHRQAAGKHSFLFYLTENLFHFVPRRALSDSEAKDLEATAAASDAPRALRLEDRLIYP
jgi:hypothetical protein